jgi:hypothetical protein
MRQPKPRDDVHDVCVFVRKCVLGTSRASRPLNILAYAFSSTSAFSLRLMPLRLAVVATPAFPGSSAPALPSLSRPVGSHRLWALGPQHITASTIPPRVRDGQTSPHRPRLVVSRSTCPPLSPSPHANSFVTGTAVINTHQLSARLALWQAQGGSDIRLSVPIT